MSPAEATTSIKKRRRWTAEQKRALVEETEKPGMSTSLIAKKYEVHPNQLFRWKRLMREETIATAGPEDQGAPLSEVKALKAKVRELERLLGKKTMEVEILKDTIEISREKKLISRTSSSKKDDVQMK